MERSRTTRSLFVVIILSLRAFIHCQNIPEIKHLDCFNDYITNMFCTWEADSPLNCSADFSLKTSSDTDSNATACYELGNEQRNGQVVPNTCRCHILRDYFFAGEEFFIEVTSHGMSVANTSMISFDKVKPLAPSIVSLGDEDEQISVTWDSKYDGKFVRGYLAFQVQVLSKLDRKTVKEKNLEQKENKYYFNKRQLDQGDFIIRIRSKSKYSSHWSEWSPETEWRNDYSLSILELKKIFIPTVCLLLIFLIIISYICIIRCKKKWWNNIPDPGKSRLAQSKRLQNKQLPSDKKPSTKTSCGNYLSRLVKAHRTKCEKPAQQPKTREHIYVNGCSDYKKVVFEPEDDIIENTVEIYPIREDKRSPTQKDNIEYNNDHHLPAEDSCFANMFSDILTNENVLSPKVDVFNNFNSVDLFGSPSLKDTLDIEKVQSSNAAVRQESGYHSYDSDESPLDVQSDDIEKDQLSYTPSVSIRETCLYQNKEVPLLNSGYKSFNNALDEAKIDSDTNPSRDGLSKNTPLLNTIGHRKCIFYSNANSLFSYNSEDNLTDISPKLGHILTTLKIKGDPASGCLVYGYKSFDQSLKENGPELGCHISGYKSFDQIVQENDLSLGCHISEYKAFDQAVQENVLEPGYHMSGYKSFDQAIQENDLSLECHMSGYKSFDQAVQENDPSLECHMSGYKSFDQAVQENDPSLECHMSGYKSFDQAVQENDPSLECHMSGYKSFDQAMQEKEPSLECHMPGYKSFDQAVQENDPSLECHMPGYKSFDQAVQENDPSLECHMSGYKCFDQAVQENDPSLECHMSGYKSFDQAVHENAVETGSHMSGYKCFDQVVQESGLALEWHISGYKSFDQAVQESSLEPGYQVSGYKSFDQMVQEGPHKSCRNLDQTVEHGDKTSLAHMAGYSNDKQVQQDGGTSVFPIFDSRCNPLENLVSPNSDVSDHTGLIHENESQYQLGDVPCQSITASPNRDEFIHDCFSTVKDKMEVVDANATGRFTLKHDDGPFALTFDICEHFRNFENIHRQKSSLHCLQPDIFPMVQPIFPCLDGKLQCGHEPTTISRENCDPVIDSFENLSYFVPFNHLQNDDLSQPTSHVLMQQIIMDKDGNTYMKLGVM